jgi:hypothetical protein
MGSASLATAPLAACSLAGSVDTFTMVACPRPSIGEGDVRVR